MAAANAHYYTTRDPLGADGDFTTAPEISQMFGELVGAWCADLWDRAGRPDVAWVELGPGRGTLAADARRAMAAAGLAPPVHFVETSATLAARQRARHPDATGHADLSTLPADRPLLVVANEFLDALPVRQLVRRPDGWHERLVACQDTLFLPIAGPPVPPGVIPAHLADAPPGAILETAPAVVAVVREVAGRLVRQGGAALFVDYGYDGPAIGDTLQAVRGHAYANPFDAPGEQDLTAHVDFATAAAAARAAGGRTHGAVGQGAFLRALGLDHRAAALARARPERTEAIAADARRLSAPEEMGTLFRALAVRAPAWPEPAGF
jgi:NADH dehydrogenase [ubiquinone] 1 alpha subcomplex assembly factor 7